MSTNTDKNQNMLKGPAGLIGMIVIGIVLACVVCAVIGGGKAYGIDTFTAVAIGVGVLALCCMSGMGLFIGS